MILPAVEETGLLISDQISKFRFNNQLKTLIKAKQKCEKAGITPKSISFKLIAPLLEGASFEDEESMTNVWASLLSNLVDSEQNIENHIFPYLLSQLSAEEWKALKTSYLEREKKKEEAKNQIISLEKEKKAAIEKKDSKLQKGIESKISNLKSIIRSEIELKYELVEGYQFSNLNRLGLIKESPSFSTYITTGKKLLSTDVYESQWSGVPEVQIDLERLFEELEIYVDKEEGEERLFFTELGELFVKSCLDIRIHRIRPDRWAFACY